MNTPSLRKTKIICTLGPASDRPETIREMILAGANVFRLNFSHGRPEDHVHRAELVRRAAADLGVHVAIMGDLQGPKIRVSTFSDGSVSLAAGAPFVLDASLPPLAGNERGVGIDYKQLPDDVNEGDVLLLDDGRIRMRVEKTEGSRVHARLLNGGVLSNNKGINKQGGGLSAAALTEKDKNDIRTAAAINVDYLAVSFPRCGEDLRRARALAEKAGCMARIVAKVERAEAVADATAMDDVILASDVVMVARGDLGVEIGDAALPGVQKALIHRAVQLDRVVITATQMMESMILNPLPTRAEVLDVANAVLDGTDAVMLSAESATGHYPVETVRAMADICRGAERMMPDRDKKTEMPPAFERVDEVIARAALKAALEIKDASAIIALTESGRTALFLSRHRSDVPIFALSRHQQTLDCCALLRGVVPVLFNGEYGGDKATTAAVSLLTDKGLLQRDTYVIITQGDIMDKIGSTNTCRIVKS